MTEAYGTVENMVRYYGNGIKNGSQIPFNFELIMRTDVNSSAVDFKLHIDAWLNNMPRGTSANWVVCLSIESLFLIIKFSILLHFTKIVYLIIFQLGNHDQWRLVSRYRSSRQGDLFNILLNTLPGVGITYYVNTNTHLLDYGIHFILYLYSIKVDKAHDCISVQYNYY